MIPSQLCIKNFLSYGPNPQTIDFESYPLICLSGKNGHGKSALLDAITWSLWGQARKTSGILKPDHGLLHLGQTHMMVIFDFVCNGVRYRIKREYAQTYGKPYTNLEFGMLEDDKKTWIPLTDKTIRTTQEVIEKTLRLSYEAFTNSAFLRQGQSHEFSTKSPKERKEILATILGLHEYELVRKKALEKIKELTIQKQTCLLYQEKLITELQKKPDIEQHYTQLKQKLQNIFHAEHETFARQKLLELELVGIQEQQKELQLLSFKREQILLLQEQLRQRLRAIRKEWREVQRSHRELPNPEELDSLRKKLQVQFDTHQQLLQKRLQLREELLQSKSELQIIEHRFIQEQTDILQKQRLDADRIFIKLEHATQQVNELSAQRDAKLQEVAHLQVEFARLTEKFSSLANDETKLIIDEQYFEKRKNFYQQYRTQGLWITNELELLQQKQQLSKDEHNPSCPLCEQNLSVSRKKFLHQKFNTQEKFLRHRLQRLTKLVASLKELLITQHTEIATRKKALDEHKQISLAIIECEKKITLVSQDVTTLATRIKELHTTQTELNLYHKKAFSALEDAQTQVSDVLKQQPSYRQAAELIRSLTKSLTDLRYDEQAHEAVSKELSRIEQKIQLQVATLRHYTNQESRKQELTSLCIQLKGLKSELTILGEKLRHCSRAQEQLERYESEKCKLNLSIKTLQLAKEDLLQQKGRLELEMSHCELLEKEAMSYKEQSAHHALLIDDYSLIAAATSKDGIQALLIEQVLPEIEYEANNLLSKLTNNQAHIIIESLRDLKKGGSKETLDIKISDAAGIRPYELFSGGEAFRIDFALRIAISKLLAHRAGTSLQTLIIDEGFGSQDDEGLSHIMDVLHKIQDDFSKVIIVSHLPAMKDNFPVHFYVEKTAQGSTVHIIEQE